MKNLSGHPEVLPQQHCVKFQLSFLHQFLDVLNIRSWDKRAHSVELSNKSIKSELKKHCLPHFLFTSNSLVITKAKSIDAFIICFMLQQMFFFIIFLHLEHSSSILLSQTTNPFWKFLSLFNQIRVDSGYQQYLIYRSHTRFD